MTQKTKKMYKNIDGKSLDLDITKDNNYLEITINFTDYTKEKNSKIQHLFILVIAYFVYLYSFSERKILVSLIFVAIFCYLILRLHSLIERETIRLVKGFVIDITSIYWRGRISSQLIQLQYIHDVIINEALYFHRAIYILQLLTKQDHHNETPIIILFQKFRPNRECLQNIYRHMKEII